MQLEHESKAKLKKDLLAIMGKYLNLKRYKIFFFGSRTSGRSRESSDIDVGIEGPKHIPLLKLSEIKEEIEKLPYLYTIEIVDFKDVSEDFYKVAKKHIEYLN